MRRRREVASWTFKGWRGLLPGGAGQGLTAHRALDDVRMLMEICAHAAAKQGISITDLFRPCVRALDVQRTLQNVSFAS